MANLPDCNVLFERYFERWYPKEYVAARGKPSILPDISNRHDLVGMNTEQISPLTPEWQARTQNQIDEMLRAAQADWPKSWAVREPVSPQWVEVFDNFFTAHKISELLKSSPEDNFTNQYVVLCCEFGAVMGHVLRQVNPRLVWLLDYPYWDSSLFDPASGISMAVFHWAIKKMSSYGVADGYVAKMGMCLQLLEKHAR